MGRWEEIERKKWEVVRKEIKREKVPRMELLVCF